MEQQFKEMKEENSSLQKNLKDCHVLLVASKMDPGKCVSTVVMVFCWWLGTTKSFPTVSGERVGEAARQNEDQRKEVMVSTFILLYMITWIVIFSCFIFFKSGSNKTKIKNVLFQNISKNLLDEIKAFKEVASEQHARLVVRKTACYSNNVLFLLAQMTIGN